MPSELSFFFLYLKCQLHQQVLMSISNQRFRSFRYFCPMQMTALQWCELLGGKLEGNPSALITHPAKIEEAGEGAISFIAHPRYVPYAYTTQASALIVSEDTEFEKKLNSTLIRVEQPYLSFSKVLEKFNKPFDQLKGIDKSSFVDASASIDEDVFVGAFSYIGK